MIRFIIDLVSEGKKVCTEAFAVNFDRSKIKDGKKILDELKNPDTTIQMAADGSGVFFNGQDISDDAE